MKQLAHEPAGQDYLEIRSTVERMFADTPDGVGVAALTELGWFDLASEMPAIAVRALFEAQGCTLATAAALEAFLVAAATRAGHELADTAGMRMLFPTSARAGALFGLGTRDASPTTYLIVGEPDQPDLLVPASEITRARHAARHLDDRLTLVEIENGIVADTSCRSALPGGLAASVVELGLAWQLVGISQALLDLGCEHATTRHQFGSPIGGFQAVQGLLADAAVDIAAAEATGDAALAAWEQDQPWQLHARVGAACACRAFATTTRTVQQVLGAIGFTWEHPFHRYLRRGLVLDMLLDGASLPARVATAARALGAPVLAPVATDVQAHEHASQRTSARTAERTQR